MTTAVHARRAAPTTATGVGAFRASWIFIGRSLRHSIRDIESMLMAVLLPIMIMLAFTFVFGGAIADSGDYREYLDYVVPGIILTCAGFGASFTAVSVSHDMTKGTINRLRTMPVPSATVLAGHTVASLARNLLATSVVVGVALLIGYRPTAGALDWLGIAGIIALWILAITAVFATLGLVAGSPEAANGYGFVLLFLPYVSSAFVPVATMPDWMRGFAQHQPVTPVIETARALLQGASPGADAVVAVVWCTGITLVAAAVAALLFPRRVAR